MAFSSKAKILIGHRFTPFFFQSIHDPALGGGINSYSRPAKVKKRAEGISDYHLNTIGGLVRRRVRRIEVIHGNSHAGEIV
jgi:hypothetical protein